MTPPASTRYGYRSASFGRASALARRLRGHPWPDTGSPPAQSLPRAAIDVLGVLTRTPSITVATSATPSGASIADYLDFRTFGLRLNRVTQSVLVIPGTHSEYLRGRARQAVRTNVRRARESGLVCAELPPDQRTLTHKPIASVRTYPDDVWLGAFDETGAVVSIAVLSIDGSVALLNALKSTSHLGRYLLHTHVVERLGQAGVGALLTLGGTSLLLDADLQYFQQRLGYEIFHIRRAHGAGGDPAITLPAPARSAETMGAG